MTSLQARGEQTFQSDTTATRAIVAVVIGNGFEWFDFISYSFFAIVIGRLFFPAHDANVSLLLSVSTIGVGFFMRPVGGIVLGALADRSGRKRALATSIFLMTLGAAIIAFAPTYEQAGRVAPAMIVLARLLQGFSAGGEMGGATAYLMARVPRERRGYYTSWIQASIGVAIILSAALGTILVNTLTPAQINSWGWRIPFVVGLLLGPVGIYIRNNLVEADVAVGGSRESVPVLDLFKNHSRSIAVGFGIVIFWTVCSYVLLFYIPTYSVKVLKLGVSAGFIAVLVGALIVFVATPVVGGLSDRFGRRPFLMSATIIAAVIAIPMFIFVNRVPDLRSLIVFQVVFGVVIALYEGPILVALSELFPDSIMSTGISVSYNLAVMTFGGFSAAIITWLIDATGYSVAPAFYVVATALLSMIAIAAWRPGDERVGADVTAAPSKIC
ncbi:MFS transporter [Burkholderia glumae]|uniref:MFS transporter n=1 Tax=Burkholderia glumae TaxID=337 RepID=UPI00214A1A1A|nr:MFS transporter [Burkholderia glumae]MCR1769793.1 MFS transporter [Burkholderia glumae]UVT00085.1 MFS transporter [Burkholderia glumae]